MLFHTRIIMLRYLELYITKYNNNMALSIRSHRWFRHHYRCHSIRRKKWAISVSIDIEYSYRTRGWLACIHRSIHPSIHASIHQFTLWSASSDFSLATSSPNVFTEKHVNEISSSPETFISTIYLHIHIHMYVSVCIYISNMLELDWPFLYANLKQQSEKCEIPYITDYTYFVYYHVQ